MRKFPKKISECRTIGLVCPSSKTKEEYVPRFISKIESMGFNVKCSDNFISDLGGYMAGDGKTRGDWVNRMFADPEVDAIICVKGGDGIGRVMEYIDYDVIRNNPKIFVGYSDITNLHMGIANNTELVTFHGPMAASNIMEDFDPETEKSFFAALNAEDKLDYFNPEGEKIGVLREGRAFGKFLGGNLSLLSAGIGTPYEIDSEGSIIFIEEVSEKMSKIEKWTCHLRNAGVFDRCSGIVLGQFTRITNKECPEYDYLACMKDLLSGIEKPILYNIRSGHESPMMTLPLGAFCTIDTYKGVFRFEVNR